MYPRFSLDSLTSCFYSSMIPYEIDTSKHPTIENNALVNKSHNFDINAEVGK